MNEPTFLATVLLIGGFVSASGLLIALTLIAITESPRNNARR